MNLEILTNFSKQPDSFQQKTVLEYFNSLKDNPNGWKICAENLLGDLIKDETAIFFCFQVIDDYIKLRYQTDSEENRIALKQLALSLFEKNLFTSNYLQNKYAHLVNSIFLIDFPAQKWNTFFNDFLSRCDDKIKCDLFLRILIQINLDIADREIPRTSKEMERNTLIKDAMRETCMVDLAQFWFNIINTYRDVSPPTVCLCLEVIGVYVSWIDINLITNDSIMANLFNLFSNDLFRCAVTDCFNAILRKGMDPLAKTQIIENFLSIEYIKTTINNIFTASNVHILEFVEKFASLVNTIGIELIDSYKKLKTKTSAPLVDNELQALNLITNSIESKFNLICQFLSHENLNVSLKIHYFVREYIQWIKNAIKENETSINQSVDEKTLILLSVIIDKSKCLSNSFNVEDDFFIEFRKSTKILFDNLILLNSNAVLNFICDKVVAPTLINWKANSIAFAEIEVALYYFYLVGENMNLISDVKQLENLVQLLVTSSISSFQNTTTQALYFDLIFRYEKLFNSSLSYLSGQILVSFLDERGLRNSSLKIRSKVCRQFSKFLKSHVKSKGNILEKQRNFTEDILKRLQDFMKIEIAFDYAEDLIEEDLDEFINSRFMVKEENIEFPYSISTSDQRHIYETVTFLIISSQHYELEQKRELIKNLFQTILEKYNKLNEEVLSLTTVINQNGFLDNLNKNSLLEKRLFLILHLRHTINLISATTKSFSNVNTVKVIGIQQLYLNSFNLFIKTMNANFDASSQHLLQSSIRHFLHRLIVCLDDDEIIPVLPNAIQSIFLTSNISPRSVQELVPLFNQIVPKYKHSWLFQRDIFPFCVQIFAPLIKLYVQFIVAANSDTDRANLQKAYYNFLHVECINDLIPSFFDLESQLVQQILGSLVEGAINFPESVVQRMCFQILTKLVEIYGQDVSQTEKQERMINSFFVQFVFKSLLFACIVAASSSVEDGQLVQEALLCLRKLHCLLGDELQAFLRMQVIPKHFPSVASSDELIGLLLLSDLKSSKKTIKQALQQFKMT